MRIGSGLVAFVTLAAGLPGAAATAQDVYPFETLLQQGDVIPGAGAAGVVLQAAVNSSGHWLAIVSLLTPQPKRVLLLDGEPILLQGQALADPPGATLGIIQQADLNDRGDVLVTAYVNIPDSDVTLGLFFNGALLLRTGSVVTAPELSPGTTFSGFYSARLNGSRQVLLPATVDDPALPALYDAVLLLLQIDDAGKLASEAALLKQAEPTPPFGLPLVMLTGNDAMALNDAGQAAVTAGARRNPGASPVCSVLLDGTALAAEMAPAPLPGATWTKLGSVDIDDAGRWVVNGSYARALPFASDQGDLIVLDGRPFAVSGQSLGEIGSTLTELGFTSTLLGSNGSLFWGGFWSGAEKLGLFVDKKLIAQNGMTLPNGKQVQLLSAGGASAHGQSRDGRFLCFGVQFTDNSRALLRVDAGPWQNLGAALAGDGDAPALLGAGTIEPGDSVRLFLTQATPGATSTLVVGLSADNLPFKGGVLVPSADLLFTALPVDVQGAHAFIDTLPPGLPSGTRLYFQHWMADSTAPFGFAASNAVVATLP